MWTRGKNKKEIVDPQNPTPVRRSHFDGSTDNRHCTDCFCYVLLLFSWTIMTLIGISAYLNGDYRVMLYPMDYDGNICGTSYGEIDMTEYKYLYYVNYYSGGVCVKECPSLPETLVDPSNLVTQGGIFTLNATLAQTDYILDVADYTTSKDAAFCTDETCFSDGDGNYTFTSMWASKGVNKGFGFAFFIVDTQEYLNRCIPTNTALQKISDMQGNEIEWYVTSLRKKDEDIVVSHNNENIGKGTELIEWNDIASEEEEENGTSSSFQMINGTMTQPGGAVEWNDTHLEEGEEGEVGTSFSSDELVNSTSTLFEVNVSETPKKNSISNIFNSWLDDTLAHEITSTIFQKEKSGFDISATQMEAAKALSEHNAGFWNHVSADLWVARQYIFGFGFGVAAGIGLVYVLLIQSPCLLYLMVWGSIFTTVGMVFFSGSYIYATVQTIWKVQDPKLHSDYEILAAEIIAYVMWGVGALLMLLTCYLRTQIQLAMGIVKETARAVTFMPCLVMFPVFQSGFFMLFVIAWMLYAIAVASLGTITPYEFTLDEVTISIRSFDYDNATKYKACYLLFCFYWTSQFIIATGEIVVSMCFARWYFGDKRKMGFLSCTCIVLNSIRETVTYHMGTAAFGSLILAVIKIIRSGIAYLQGKAKEIDNKVGEAILCCLQCCCWCFEKSLTFLNKNAYIQTAIFGGGFCESSQEAFFLILRNASRIGAVTYMTEAVVLVGKLFICVMTGCCSYFAMDNYIGDQVYSVVGPSVFVGFLAYFVSDMFMSIFDMGTGTLLHCFCADEEVSGEGGRHAEKDLQEWIEQNGATQPRSVKVT